MRVVVESFLACESLRLEGDLYFLLAGGMSSIRVNAFPARTSFHVASRMAISGVGDSQSLQFKVVVEDETGRDLLDGTFNPILLLDRVSDTRRDPERYNLPLNFNSMIFPKPEYIRIAMRLDGTELASTGFDIRT